MSRLIWYVDDAFNGAAVVACGWKVYMQPLMSEEGTWDEESEKAVLIDLLADFLLYQNEIEFLRRERGPYYFLLISSSYIHSNLQTE